MKKETKMAMKAVMKTVVRVAPKLAKSSKYPMAKKPKCK